MWVARGVRAKPSGQQSQTRGGAGDPLRGCEDFAEGWQKSNLPFRAALASSVRVGGGWDWEEKSS